MVPRWVHGAMATTVLLLIVGPLEAAPKKTAVLLLVHPRQVKTGKGGAEKWTWQSVLVPLACSIGGAKAQNGPECLTTIPARTKVRLDNGEIVATAGKIHSKPLCQAYADEGPHVPVLAVSQPLDRPRLAIWPADSDLTIHVPAATSWTLSSEEIAWLLGPLAGRVLEETTDEVKDSRDVTWVQSQRMPSPSSGEGTGPAIRDLTLGGLEADLDGDGKPERVCSIGDALSLRRGPPMFVLRGEGFSDFEPLAFPNHHATGWGYPSNQVLGVIDLDRDGRFEMMVLAPNCNEYGVWIYTYGAAVPIFSFDCGNC